MRDIDIRTALRQRLLQEHAEDPTTALYDEFAILQGETRADIVVVNGTLQAYEIKSDRDTLERLPHQATLYSKVFDYVTLVVDLPRLRRAKHLIPHWWGIMVPSTTPTRSLIFHVERPGQPNPAVEPTAVARLLWKDESLDLLAERHADHGLHNKPRWVIWDRLCQVYTLPELQRAVRQRLIMRQRQR